MNLPPLTDVKTEERARDIAIEWQATTQEEAMSWGEAIEHVDYFTVLANKYNLTDEFKENGII